MKVCIKDFNLKTISNSGQIFRMKMISDNDCELISKDKYLIIKQLDTNHYDFSCSKNEYENYYSNYFDLNNNYDKYKKVVLKDDCFLKDCIKFGTGLKILNQDPFEMLISFIISQRKSIKAIQTSIEKIALLCGKEKYFQNKKYYSFPTPVELYNKRNKLSSCGLGYRLPYIVKATEQVLSNEINLLEYYNLDSEKLLEELLKIKGVGNKVASCIMLFAYHRIDICPKDVWINRVIEKKYNGVIPKAYKKYQGIIQQYWFYYAKEHKVF